MLEQAAEGKRPVLANTLGPRTFKNPFIVETNATTFDEALRARISSLSKDTGLSYIDEIAQPVSLREVYSVVPLDQPPAIGVVKPSPNVNAPADATSLFLDLERRAARLESTIGSTPFLPHPALNIPAAIARLEARSAHVIDAPVKALQDQASNVAEELRRLVAQFDEATTSGKGMNPSSPLSCPVPADSPTTAAVSGDDDALVGHSARALAARVDVLHGVCGGYDADADILALTLQRLGTLRGVLDDAVAAADAVRSLGAVDDSITVAVAATRATVGSVNTAAASVSRDANGGGVMGVVDEIGARVDEVVAALHRRSAASRV